jgi:hypothetical protein
VAESTRRRTLNQFWLFYGTMNDFLVAMTRQNQANTVYARFTTW